MEVLKMREYVEKKYQETYKKQVSRTCLMCGKKEETQLELMMGL